MAQPKRKARAGGVRARVRQNGFMYVMGEHETVQKESKIGGTVAKGRDKVGAQELDVIHTKGLNMMLPKKDPF